MLNVSAFAVIYSFTAQQIWL